MVSQRILLILGEIFSKFKKNTKYEINRARREGVEFSIEEDFDLFLNYYNDFAKSKNYELLAYSTLNKYRNYMLITKAVKDDNILTMHVYIHDNQRAILLYSASQFRNTDDTKYRNLIGYSNRFLHFEGMVYFKKLGYKVYDFGGYALDTTDIYLERINSFKDSFGGVLLHEYIYTSYMLKIFITIKRLFNFFGLKTKKM